MANATCKICGGSSPAETFKLHFNYKCVVCPKCFSGRTEQMKKKQQVQEKKIDRPPGWDAEDEYLDKISKMRKEENQAQFSKIPGTNQVKCRCSKCKYSFKYDPFRKMPRTCPFCDSDIPRLKTFNLL